MLIIAPPVVPWENFQFQAPYAVGSALRAFDSCLPRHPSILLKLIFWLFYMREDSQAGDC